MAAIVDGAAERGVVEAAAASACLRSLLIDHNPPAGLRQPDGGGQPGQPGADHMDGLGDGLGGGLGDGPDLVG